MDGRCSMDLRNNQPNDGVGGGGRWWRGDSHGWNAWGGMFSHRFGWRMETKIYINRDGDGASDFDGFCWIGGHNNQPKIDRIVKVASFLVKYV